MKVNTSGIVKVNRYIRKTVLIALGVDAEYDLDA